MIEEARVPSFPLGHLVLVIRSVRIDGAHEVRPTMPSSAACSRSVPVRVTERVDEHCGEEEWCIVGGDLLDVEEMRARRSGNTIPKLAPKIVLGMSGF